MKTANVRTASFAVAMVVGVGLCGALGATDTGRVVLLALAGTALLIWQPTIVLVLILLITQEIKPATGFSGMTVFGSEFYFSLLAKIPIIGILVAAAAFVAILKRGKALIRIKKFQLTFFLALLLAFGVAVSGLATGMDITSALGQVSRPFIIFMLAWIVGASYSSDVKALRSTAIAGGVAVVILAATGLPSALAAAAGGRLVYYDTATAAAAAAVLLAILRSERLTKGRVAIAACAAVVLLVSFRRSVIISLIVILVLMIFVNKQYHVMVKRVVVWGGCFILLGLIAFPSLLSTFADRLLVSYSTLNGVGEDVSTTGHLDDIAIGLQYALEQPNGYGPQSQQLTGFFVQSGSLYVHNELLLDWLRFGLIGLLAVIVLFYSMTRDSIGLFRMDQSLVPTAVSAGSFFVPIFVISSLSAPFLTTTSRWPAILGLAAGIMADYKSAEIHTSPGATE
ncbi:O-antigen ligase family protein [Arthrobacter sp. FW306-2-2C-D06B]|uniref:O-antigen ligase family protein n=1 Tax=Arthrobacter sp. FW306-2-2C-D06B TaxID=2879618 RepID=UPI001F1C01A6|nr:O-antigen ligase family protein [Arthrobacter sp. FW306-2-2C-D06B]UKA57999.1 hypothetical protein LFT47_17215 [Arthrobacter sp. FW306-2-2C-D06B]